MIIVIEFNGMAFWAIKPKSLQKTYTHHKCGGSGDGAGVALFLYDRAPCNN